MIKLKINEAEINKRLTEAAKSRLDNIVRILRVIGEQAVNYAKINGNYQDRTANLRNSIGFVIVLDGVIIDELFEKTIQPKEVSKENPIKTGRDLAYQLAEGKQGLSLIVVAGMSYASYVTSKGFDVLISSEREARKLVNELIKN